VKEVLTIVMLVNHLDLTHQPVHVNPDITILNIQITLKLVEFVTTNVPNVLINPTIVSLVPLTEFLYQIVPVQLLITMMVLLLIANHVHLLVVLVLLLMLVLNVVMVIIFTMDNVSLLVQKDIGLILLLILVILVMPTVKLVAVVDITIVPLVMLQNSYKMDNVKSPVMMDPILMITPELANLVTVTVKLVTVQLKTIVLLVKLQDSIILITMEDNVSSIVHGECMVILTLEPVILVTTPVDLVPDQLLITVLPVYQIDSYMKTDVKTHVQVICTVMIVTTIDNVNHVILYV
jgi:hypothetical protein